MGSEPVQFQITFEQARDAVARAMYRLGVQKQVTIHLLPMKEIKKKFGRAAKRVVYAMVSFEWQSSSCTMYFSELATPENLDHYATHEVLHLRFAYVHDYVIDRFLAYVPARWRPELTYLSNSALEELIDHLAFALLHGGDDDAK